MNVRREYFFLFLGSLAFALAHTQAPLYWSNQNQYFLHGLAQGGLGELHRDWLANTADPTPVFSAGVALVYRYTHEFVYYVLFAAILALYFISLMALASALPIGPRTPTGRLRLAFGLIAIHAAIARWGSVQLLGADYPWFLQAGVAGQYVLGPCLQPSVFGVLLVAAIAAFAHNRLACTVLCVAIACTVHPTYLLSGAFLTLGFMHVLWWEKRKRSCIAFGAATLLAVLPVVIDSARRFGPTTPADFAAAQKLLAEFRIPHHALIERWFDWVAALQIVWIALGIVLARRTRLFVVLLIAFLGSAALTLAQWFIQSDALALLFPWRVSAVLAPVATTIILARAIVAFHPSDAPHAAEPRRSPWTMGILSALIVSVVAGSLWLQFSGTVYRFPMHEDGLYEFVRSHRRPGDVYLLPIPVPHLSAGERGSPSTTFGVRERANDDTRIPIDLQRFRLETGTPIYVDFKAVPYKDVEVLEWRQRLANEERWIANLPAAELRSAGITHVVLPAERDVSAGQIEKLFEDAYYQVIKVK